MSRKCSDEIKCEKKEVGSSMSKKSKNTYKNIESFLYNEFDVKMLSFKKISISKQSEIKENLVQRDFSELRSLKSDAAALSDWFKSLGVIISILGVVFTMFIGFTSTTNQNLNNFLNSYIDIVQEQRLKDATALEDAVMREVQANKVIEDFGKIKADSLDDIVRRNLVTVIFSALFLGLFMIFYVGTSRKGYAVNNIISEAIEEKKYQLEVQNKQIEKETASTQELNRLREMDEHVQLEKIKEQTKLRVERLNQKYRS